MSGGAAAFGRILFDYCCAPSIGRWREEFVRIRTGLLTDYEHLKRHKSIFRRRPEKGFIRLALFAGWLGLHMYALIVLSIYHAFTNGHPVATTWWFWSTAFSGCMYLGLMYSDPGFIDKEMLIRLTENLNLGASVVASDVGRGLLQDVAGDAPNMQPINPAADPDDPEAGGAPAAGEAAGEDAAQDLLRPPLTREQRQEEWDRRQRKEDAASLAHARAYWAQRPQDWSEYGTLVVPGTDGDGAAAAKEAAAAGQLGGGKENGDSPAEAAAAGDGTDLSESSNASSAAASRGGHGGKGAKGRHEAAQGVARADDVEIELGEAAQQRLPGDDSSPGGSEDPPAAGEGGAGSSSGGGGGARARGTCDAEITVVSGTQGAKAAPSKGRAKVLPTGGGGGGGGGDNSSSSDEEDATSLAHTLARNPRIVGYDEEGEAEAAAEAARVAEWRRRQPLGVADFFSGYCDEEDMYLPIRAKYCKKHGRVVAKFDHYCYAVGTSIGELNHGRFYRLLCAQVVSIWMGEWLLSHSYLSFTTTVVWSVANAPLIVMNLLTWIIGIPLSILLCMHTFMMLTASTTYEFIKLEKLEYLNGFYQFSFPFSEGLFQNIRHFCCPKGVQLWRRAPPENEWPETFWRNRYYSCCG
jgi:hypothetical protein